MHKLKSELVFLKTLINSYYGTEKISTSVTMKKILDIKKVLKRIEVRKNKILSLKNGR